MNHGDNQAPRRIPLEGLNSLKMHEKLAREIFVQAASKSGIEARDYDDNLDIAAGAYRAAAAFLECQDLSRQGVLNTNYPRAQREE